MRIGRVAAVLCTTVSAGAVASYVALATGASWGAYAMGGAFPGQSPLALRASSAVVAVERSRGCQRKELYPNDKHKAEENRHA